MSFSSTYLEGLYSLYYAMASTMAVLKKQRVRFPLRLNTMGQTISRTAFELLFILPPSMFFYQGEMIYRK